MGLIGNYSVLHKSPGRFVGGTVASGDAANWGKPGMLRARQSGGAAWKRVAIPVGFSNAGTWFYAQKIGDVASRYSADGGSDLFASGAMGVNGEAAVEGTASFDAVGQLVVSAVASILGTGLLTGNVVAALSASASLAGQGSFTGAIAALGWVLAQTDGTSPVTATVRASGALAATIDIGVAGPLTPQSISEEILDKQLVETGMTVRETLRACVAALAGKVAGANGTEVIIRSAIDHKDRIIATVDADGNRTAVALDLT